MNVSDLSLKDLEYVLAVAEFKSFIKAAEACSVSQPALSKQIKSIETTLGLALFERNKRHVFLTPTGAAFVQQAQTVLDEAQKLVTLTQQSLSPLMGVFRLGVIASSCPYLLPYFVGALGTAYPQLQLVIKEGLTHDLVKSLKDGNLDAVIAATTFEDSMLTCSPLFFEPFYLAANRSAGYGDKKPIHIGDIDTRQLLLLEDGHCLKDQTLEICALNEHSRFSGFKATSVETLLQMTAGGLGVSVIPALALPRGNQLQNILTFSAFKNKQNGRTMALYTRTSYPHTQNIRHLATLIQAHLPASVSVCGASL